MKDEKLARVRVRRHNPAQESEPYFQEYAGVPFENRSVLAVLHLIFGEQDPSLAYRHVCTTGYCGSCMLLVNGVPVLACQHPAQAEMTIEPHPKFPVVRDLVVDLKLSRVNPGGEQGLPQVVTHAPSPVSAVLERPLPQIDQHKCVHCQDCVGVCPVGVYGFVNKRVQVVDADSCLGPSCNMCVDTCWKLAIKMVGAPDAG